MIINPNKLDNSIKAKNIKDSLKVIYELSIEEKKNKIFSEFTLGPLVQDSEKVEYSLNILLKENGLENIKITNSKGVLRTL